MSVMASQITSLMIVCSNVYSGADQRKHQSSASLAFVQEFTGEAATRKIFPFDDVIMNGKVFMVALEMNCHADCIIIRGIQNSEAYDVGTSVFHCNRFYIL